MRINYKPIWLSNCNYAEGYSLYSIPLWVYIKGHRGVLHIYFNFTFGLAYCGVYLFLNGFLKSPEKLTAEKAQKSSYIQLYKYIALFDIQYIREKDTLPCYR